jgi:hypothetical protein
MKSLNVDPFYGWVGFMRKCNPAQARRIRAEEGRVGARVRTNTDGEFLERTKNLDFDMLIG